MGGPTQVNRLKVLARGTVVASQTGTQHQSNTAAWVCVLPTGRWLVSYRAARDKNDRLQRVMVTWSEDEGRTWSKPFAPFPDPRLNGRPGQFRAMACTALGGNRLVASLWWVDVSEPHKPFFNEKTEGIVDSHLFLAKSNDHGARWSKPARVSTAPFDRLPCPLTGPILLLPNGHWLAQFEPARPYDRVEKHHYMPAFTFSRDQGKTWNDTAQPPHDPDHAVCYGDQRPSVLNDGALVDFFWTFDTRRALHLPIHATVSRDSGRTWSSLWDTGVPGQPAPARSLPDGRLALIYVDRGVAPAIKLRISDDGGRTFPEDTELVLHQPPIESQTRSKQTTRDMWAEMQHYSVGLPDTVSLPSGDMLVTFYSGAHPDRTGIEWVRIGVH